MAAQKRLGRFLKLSQMTASVAGHYIGARIKDTILREDPNSKSARSAHAWAGRRIAATLGELKGPLMKIGQMASISSGLLPKEISEALAVLRKDVSFAPYDVIARQIERELGAAPERLFKSFEAEPFAAASIGQVHRAVTDDGREVVVKVQYPDISDSVDADIAQLRFALKAAGIMRGRRELFNEFFSDIAAQLREELDYCNEADNLRLLRAFHKDRHPHIRIPAVVGERSSGRVLTMTFESGDTLEEAGMYPAATRNAIAARLIELVYSEILLLGALHADPNPANFAFRADGDIVLYDFGSIKKFTPSEQKGVRLLLRGIFDSDPASIARGFDVVGMLNPEGPPPSNALFEGVIKLLAPAVQLGTPFDFGTSDIHRKVLALWPKIRTHAGAFRLSAAMMMIQRVNVGSYGNLRKLNARAAVRDIIEKVMAKPLIL